MKIKIILLFPLFSLLTGLISCGEKKSEIEWPAEIREQRPGTRWWWLGSAVDKENLTRNMEDLSNSGIKAVEITPIYGIKGAEDRHIAYLSPGWMEMYKHVVAEGKRLNMEIGMSNGTGWPFGGPEITSEYAATKAIFQHYQLNGGQQLGEKIEVRDSRQKPVATLAALMACSATGERKDLLSFLSEDGTLNWEAPPGEWTIWALFNGKTFQKVKRAAPGGEGFVMNHYSKEALKVYLDKFDTAFQSSGAPYPHTFFNDSYEVYGADWSENLLEEFESRRGYRLQDYLPELNRIGDPDICARVVCDYRETLGEILLDNFTIPWTEWAHSHGAITRNQAHGSPGNLIDYYAAVDIPECESFGRTHFNIPGLRVDSGMKESDSHPSVLKYASSAAHITGKKYVSSETFTWLTEHFRTSLSQMKPELDLLFLSGVNHMFYHGSTYSPEDAAWPGWLFYATVNMNRNNTIFKDSKAFNDYITRTQSFLQYGEPDNDFLVYMPVYDIWQKEKGLYLLFDIHKILTRLPDFFEMVVEIQKYGYDTDYISDKYLQKTEVKNGSIKTEGAGYKAIIVPNVNYIPLESMQKLLELADKGATVIFTDRFPEDVPGYGDLDNRRNLFHTLCKDLPVENEFSGVNSLDWGNGKILYGDNHKELLDQTDAEPEKIPLQYKAQLLRRKHSDGHHYFISMLDNHRINGFVPVSVDIQSAMIYNPMTGESGKAKVRHYKGKAEIFLQMEPGESLIVKTFDKKEVESDPYLYFREETPYSLTGEWVLKFTDGMPEIHRKYVLSAHHEPYSWTEINNDTAKVYAGTACYSYEFEFMPNTVSDDYILDLGQVCESARVVVNGQEVGTVWALPYKLKIGKYLKEGSNLLEIYVTNLPANRIRQYDKDNVEWRIFHDINVVSVFYKDIRYDSWPISPSGLTGGVKLIPIHRIDTI